MKILPAIDLLGGKAVRLHHVESAVVGRALYDGSLSLEDAIAASR
jgi:phosphoribosylformimino-5-aminoimidazole carboxamide ribonucleotide (ProFAR) isomerase